MKAFTQFHPDAQYRRRKRRSRWRPVGKLVCLAGGCRCCAPKNRVRRAMRVLLRTNDRRAISEQLQEA